MAAVALSNVRWSRAQRLPAWFRRNGNPIPSCQMARISNSGEIAFPASSCGSHSILSWYEQETCVDFLTSGFLMTGIRQQLQILIQALARWNQSAV